MSEPLDIDGWRDRFESLMAEARRDGVASVIVLMVDDPLEQTERTTYCSMGMGPMVVAGAAEYLRINCVPLLRDE